MMTSDQEKQIAELRNLVVDISVLVRRKYERDVQPWPVGFYYLNHFRNVEELRYALQMIYGGIGMCKVDSLTDMGFPHLEMMAKIETICRKIQKVHGFPEGADDAILRDFSAQLRHPSEAEPEFISTVANNLNRWNSIVQGTQSCVTTNPVIPELVKGDLLDQKVDVIVNAWNRNLIPWWLLLPQGVSGAIKKRGGCAPFKEVSKAGIMSLGSAVLTRAGRLPFRGIIHVAGINLCWTATEYSVRQSVRSAMEIVNREGFQSVAFPIIGSDSGNRSKKWALDLILDEFKKIESSARVVIVEFVKEDNVHG